MLTALQRWRKQKHLTQVDAAALLGVSQPYLSLLEKGARPVTPEIRRRLLPSVGLPPDRHASDDRKCEDLSALGYPGFGHYKPTRGRLRADALLLSILAQPDADARLVAALPWLIRHHAADFNLPWLVRQAKLRDLQNRLGFLLATSAAKSPKIIDAVQELEKARLLREDTLCWDSMRPNTRSVLRERRSATAAHWNIVTLLRPEDRDYDS